MDPLLNSNPFLLPLLLLLIVPALYEGGSVRAIPYDYYATLECLNEPLKPQYGGGIILNPEFNNGLQGWSRFGGGEIQLSQSQSGNKFLVSRCRNQSYDSATQKLQLLKDNLYTLSAWVQVSDGEAPVHAVFKTPTGYSHAGVVHAKAGCWSMLKGGLNPNVSGAVDLYFETKNTSVDIWLDNVSLQPFTREEWRSHAADNVEKVRKKRVRILVADKNGTALPGAEVSLMQTRSAFGVGCAVNRNILTNLAYQNWFTSRFKVTEFENEMKWYINEPALGREDYSATDALMRFAKMHGVSVRGHNVLWDDVLYQPLWVRSLSGAQLMGAAQRRVNSIMTRYKGQVIAWDVVNENLHHDFFEINASMPGASASFYHQASKIDPTSTLFMNEYNTLEYPTDPMSKPGIYIDKVKEMAAAASPTKVGIGLEGHFRSAPNIAYMRSALDLLASTRFPIWLTELDVASVPGQAQHLHDILTEAHAHSAVQGVVIWAAWSPRGCYSMCLTDSNFKNLPTGDVVDELLGLWKPSPSVLSAVTDREGFVDANLFRGDYELTVRLPDTATSAQSANVPPDMGYGGALNTLRFTV